MFHLIKKSKIKQMNQITQSLRDSKTARWGALAVVSFTMMTGYYINYVISPLKPLLRIYGMEFTRFWSSGIVPMDGLMCFS
jgi:hypothetical protein